MWASRSSVRPGFPQFRAGVPQLIGHTGRRTRNGAHKTWPMEFAITSERKLPETKQKTRVGRAPLGGKKREKKRIREKQRFARDLPSSFHPPPPAKGVPHVQLCVQRHGHGPTHHFLAVKKKTDRRASCVRRSRTACRGQESEAHAKETRGQYDNGHRTPASRRKGAVLPKRYQGTESDARSFGMLDILDDGAPQPECTHVAHTHSARG